MHSRVRLSALKSAVHSAVDGAALAAGSSLMNPSFTSARRCWSPTWPAGVASACRPFLTPRGSPSRPTGCVKFSRPLQPSSIAPENRTSIASKASPGCVSWTRPPAPSRFLVVPSSTGSWLARSGVAAKGAFRLSMPFPLMSVPCGTTRGHLKTPSVWGSWCRGCRPRWRRYCLTELAIKGQV